MGSYYVLIAKVAGQPAQRLAKVGKEHNYLREWLKSHLTNEMLFVLLLVIPFYRLVFTTLPKLGLYII